MYYASTCHGPRELSLISTRRLCQATIAVISAIAAITFAGCDTATTELRLVKPTEDVDLYIIEDVAELLADSARVNVQLSEEALSEVAALDAVASGEADLALVSNYLPFRGDIATVMPLYPTVLHILRRDGGDVFDVIAGRQMAIYAGPEGSASRLVFRRIAERMHLGSDDYRFIESLEDTPDIVIVFAPITPGRIDELREINEEILEFRLASMGSVDDVGKGTSIDAAVLLNPHIVPFVIPLGTYGEMSPEAALTVAVDKILVARHDLDSAVVYDLINEVLRLRPALAARRQGVFQNLEDDFDVSRSTFIVHPGTQSYLQRDAPSVYERYSGVAEVVATIVLGLVSAIFGGMRLYKMRRKNRIDTFYVRTIALQRAISEQTSDDDRQRIAAEVRDLQTRAFDMLIDEKLAADESFRIFITLSNDVLRQLGNSTAAVPIGDA